MECKFHVGQKVVCFRDIVEEMTFRQIHDYDSMGGLYPTVGAVYTVRSVWKSPFTGEVGVYLDEIRNPLMDTQIGPFELPFHASCFRPVSERKTDISVFKAMLTPKTEQVPA
jgi:hypothetical protein